MKTLLTLLLLAACISVQSQTVTSTITVSQDALKSFEDGWIKLDYGTLRETDKLTMIQTWVGLKVSVAKELDTNRKIADAATEAERQAELQRLATEKQSKLHT